MQLLITQFIAIPLLFRLLFYLTNITEIRLHDKELRNY
jgi:hypothetical protein